MSLGPEQIEALIRASSAVYASAEQLLIGRVATAVAEDARDPRSGVRRWNRMNQFRSVARELMAGTYVRGRREAMRALAESADRGRRAAMKELPPGWLRETAPRVPRTPAATLVRAPAGLLPSLSRMHPHILASTEGLYRQVMAGVLSSRIQGEAGRVALAQQMLDRFAARGITGFVDRRGRRINLVNYVEKATRTACARAAMDTHTALLSENGYDLVRVSTVANCSPQCAPFQGRLLSLTGATHGAIHAGRSVPVVASLSEARARGLHHPGCRHGLRLWVPGDDLPNVPSVDPAGYEATQQLRALEREVRAAKRMRAAAITPAAIATANTRVRAAQKQIRELVDETGVPRMRRREQIDLGYRTRLERPAMVTGNPGPPGPDSPRLHGGDGYQRQLQRLTDLDVTATGFEVADQDTFRELVDAVVDMHHRYPWARAPRLRTRDLPERHMANAGGNPDPDNPGGWIVGRLSVSETVLRDRPALLASLEQDEQGGFHPRNSARRGMWSVIVHEFGHVIDHLGNHTARRKVLRTVTEVMSRHPEVVKGDNDTQTRWLRSQMSGYSFRHDNPMIVDPVEVLGEAFLDVELNGDDATEVSRALHEMLLAQVPEARKQ